MARIKRKLNYASKRITKVKVELSIGKRKKKTGKERGGEKIWKGEGGKLGKNGGKPETDELSLEIRRISFSF